MFTAAVFLICLPSLVLCGSCRYDTPQNVFTCVDVDLDEFTYEIFKQRSTIDDDEINIFIFNSKFDTIESFPNLKELVSLRVRRLTIQNSSIKYISDTAFVNVNPTMLDLSHNELEDLSFVNNLQLQFLNVSYNIIQELNLNYIENTYQLVLSISHNNISSMIPSTNINNPTRIQVLDLNYNNLIEFNESKLNINVDSLYINYNKITLVEFTYGKGIVSIIGNNVTKINAINAWSGISIGSAYLSFIPETEIRISNVLSVSNTFIPSLEGFLNLTIASSLKIHLTNNSITNVSENYFKNLYIDELNLGFNNLTVLNTPLFLDSSIQKIDFSNNNLKKIGKDIFNGRDRSDQTLNLSGNPLKYFEDICQEFSPTVLDLSLTKLDNITYETFQNCSSLKILHISQSSLVSTNFFINTLEFLNLSGNFLTDVIPGNFSNLTQLTILDLSKNQISDVGSNSFQNMYTLKHLNLSHNLIEHIGEFAFSNLKSLISLNLENNKIRILEGHVFSNLAVTNLNLQGNSIRYIKAKAFDSLYNLEKLNLTGLELSTLENEVFYNLNQLRNIDLSNNDLRILDNSTFVNIPILSILKLNGNPIKQIKSGAFNNLPVLENLNLSDLGISTLEPFAFSDLCISGSIDLTNNNITGIERNVFKNIIVDKIFLNRISEPIHLDNTVNVKNLTVQYNGILYEQSISNNYIKYLYFINSQIDLMQNDSLFGCYNLKQLNFINSTISATEPQALAGLFYLEEFDASPIFTTSQILNDYVFRDLERLNKLNISGTNISVIQENAFYGLSRLTELNLNKNNINLINGTSFKWLNSSLLILNLSENPLRSINLNNLTSYLSQLNTLNISFSTLMSLSGTESNDFPEVHPLRNLYLNNNSITHIPKDAFKTLTNLQTLLLNNNKINSIDFMSFINMTNLVELGLEFNNLEKIPVGVFDGIESLKTLSLSNNSRIFYNGFESDGLFLNNFKQLNSLYLDGTGLTQFTYSNFLEIFPRLNKIAINNNLFTCLFLSKLLIYFDEENIRYTPENPIYDQQNLNGIVCK